MGSYEDLGVKTYINARGPATMIGGSLMPREVREAMMEAAQRFVNMDDLHRKAGQRLAEMTGAPAAYVCSGAAGGLTLAAAACMAGCDRMLIEQLPNAVGMRSEIIVQRAHRIDWEQSFRQAGATIVEAASGADGVAAAITERTAAIAYFFATSGEFPVDSGESASVAGNCALARAAGVPVIVDAASELPPASNLTAYLNEGADLVIFSGGKGLRGPQCTGLILGRPDLIEACRLNASPWHSIGRGMKVGKEEVMGLVKAVELFLARDEEQDRAEWQRMVGHIVGSVSDLPGVSAEASCDQTQSSEGRCCGTGWLHSSDRHRPPFVPLGLISLGPQCRLNTAALVEALRAGEPGIIVGGTSDGRIVIHPQVMASGEEEVVAKRLRALLGPTGGVGGR